MSRVANNPVKLPSGTEVKISGQDLSVKGGKGQMEMVVHGSVAVVEEDGELKFSAKDDDREGRALAGTMRAVVANMVTGVSQGFERGLELQGVGYRAQAQGNKLTLQLGFSHPVEYALPEGIEAKTPSQTEIVISGIDKQRVGQVCAEIRAFRPPEPYKGKGVRYAGEQVRRKEAKKK
ncbi:MAG TPA: 50S ribosomal protein L6 [Gammaproteobacteria bacterium]|jgi:large subunit ribosomal protein L6|nr:50S ribosomal protein L6 [Gammaproteobacteria bacterium]|tara:strand:- start:11674 stop:12207 length:534 start_codon:yes stop_codon:yes gene_type:complete